MKKNLLSTVLIFILTLVTYNVNAQFLDDSTQTYFVCNATGSQRAVRAFSDGNGGTFSFWLDKRDGLVGSSIYGQHLDSLGNPQWASNGKFFTQAAGKEIWLMDAIQWQSGILLAWIQGGFGVGGDTLLCQYFDNAGTPQWSSATLVGNKQGSIIYVSTDNLDIFPNDNGATITFGLVQSGGNTYYSFNNIDNTGNLVYPLNSKSYSGGGYYYRTAPDHKNGFYVATATGGLGSHIFVGHFDEAGNSTISSPVDISTVAGGRGGDQWKVVCDNDTNAYVVWDSNSPGDVYIAKINPDGNLPWGGGGAKPICTVPGYKANPEVIISNDTISVIWNDPRLGAANYKVYMQKLDTAGNSLWTPDGILLSDLPSYNPYPKLVKVGTNVVATFTVGSKFRAQQIAPDSSILWQQNGIAVNISNLPFYDDYVLVPSLDGTVTAIWRENMENICASRIRPNGTLTNITNIQQGLLSVYPNPATDELNIILPATKNNEGRLSVFNSMGSLVKIISLNNSSDGHVVLNTSDLISGYYFIKLNGPDMNMTAHFCVVK
ncbi:MAG: T9SS type A sorting domain-containing protein [Bacteroidetes bacterium]|nr:T9SS type A sorting domain-containing protein [Bacteroidota bacterium]